MSWQVDYYSKETEKFLDKIPKLDKGHILEEIKTLQLFGLSELNDSLKKMSGLTNVWEVKVRQYRVFVMHAGSETLQILNIIRKKSNKTPLDVIQLLRFRAKLFEEK